MDDVFLKPFTLSVVNLIMIIFGAGVLWQKVNGFKEMVEKRLERIERVLNGDMKRGHKTDNG